MKSDNRLAEVVAEAQRTGEKKIWGYKYSREGSCLFMITTWVMPDGTLVEQREKGIYRCWGN